MSIPTIGATVTTAVNVSTGSTSPLTGSHTTDANTDLLIVMVGYGFDASDRHAQSVSFGGATLTELDTVVQGNDARTDIWYRKNPDIETATISVGNFGGGSARIGWTAINVIGVDIVGTTFGTSVELASGATNDLSVTLSSATDELCLVSSVVEGTTTILTSQSGTTELSNLDHDAHGRFATGSKAGASSVDLGFDINLSREGVALGVPIKPAAAAGVLGTYGWRLRADDGVEGSGGASFLAIEDVAILIGSSGDVDLDTNFRVRLGLDETNTGDPVASAIQLRAKLNGGAAFSVDAASTYVRVSASGQFTDGDPTTDHGLAAPAGSFVAGQIIETTGLTGSIDLTQNGYTIVEACVRARSADLASGDTLEFGLRYGGADYFPGAVMATVQPSPPTSVTIGAVGDTTLGITWTDPAPSNVVIRPYYKKAADAEWIPEGALPIGTEAHTFGDLTPLIVGTSYDVGVASYDSPLESAIVFVTQGTTGADRQAHVTAFELEVETAPRKAVVTAFEFEVTESAGRQAIVTAFELRTYNAAQGDPVASLGKLGLGLSPMGLGI